jgi:hypothetical protein
MPRGVGERRPPVGPVLALDALSAFATVTSASGTRTGRERRSSCRRCGRHGTGVTVRVRDALATPPRPSATVRRIVYVPGAAKACAICLPPPR